MTLASESLGVVRLLADAVPAAGPTRARPRPLPARRPAKAPRTGAGEPRRGEAALAAVLARPGVARRLQAVPAGEVADAGAAAGLDAAAPVEAEVIVARPLTVFEDDVLGRAGSVESHFSPYAAV